MFISSSRIRDLLIFLALALWIIWLRAPSLQVPLWNVDESIHAAAARTLVEGGTLYRDAIDQRTPLTYYVFAGIFRVAGLNNLFAVRVAIALMISATAFGLFVIGRRTFDGWLGGAAALIYAALANYLLLATDTLAAHTEWFVAFFTTAAAVVFFRSPETPGFRRAILVGTLFGLAFLSKQPGLTDLGAPVGSLLLIALVRAAPWRETVRALTGLIAGFVITVGTVFAAFAAAGVGRDLLFYVWTYNFRYYGPEVGWRERLLSIEPIFSSLYLHYPILLIVIAVGGAIVTVRVLQVRIQPGDVPRRRSESYLLLWCATSLVGAMSSGRGYPHYFFQCLPPLAWLAAWTFRSAVRWLDQHPSLISRAVKSLSVAALMVAMLCKPPAARHEPLPPKDPALPIADYIQQHSDPTDKIFVWGFNPDIYMYAHRAPGSRYLYCTFQTGLIPWTNEAPEIDTRYAIVPGAMDTLLDDLRRNRPTFIVDCGVGPHRRFSKYPLQNFAPLAEFVAEKYVEVDPATFRARGFRLFIIRDTQGPIARASDGRGQHPLPMVSGPTTANTFIAAAESPSAALVRLALEADGVEAAAVRLRPSASLKYQAAVPVQNSSASRKVRAVADWSDGTRTVSESLTAIPELLDTSENQRRAFALPMVAGAVTAEGVRAYIDPNVSTADGETHFNLHAPSLLRYALPPRAIGVRGRFAIVPGAYAPENKGPTDGAVFIVRRISKEGSKVLFEKYLRPASEPADRSRQAFHVDLPQTSDAAELEFEISPGPHGNIASDWAYWIDLMLEVSP
jgi:4-amino-4-deoxy-L-arabinose transferase-like glycosyltransferase